MLVTSKKNIIVYLALIFIAQTGLVNAAGLIKADRGQATYCKSLKDYEKSKTGVYSVAEPQIDLKDQNSLSIRIKVDVSQCHKQGETNFRWKSVNPNENIEYKHSYNDLDSGEYVTRTVTVENRRVWMAAVNKNYKLVATSDVKGDLESGFIADFNVDISTIFTQKQIAQMMNGESVTGRVGVFLKAIKRYVSDEIVTSYKEVASGGMYFVLVSMRGDQGKLQIL